MAKRENKMMKRRLAGAYLSSLVSISLVLLLVGVAAFLLVNAKAVSDYFKESFQVSVLLKQEVSQAKAESHAADVSALPFVHGVQVISREQGTEEMKSLLGEDFLSVFETSPVPVSLSVTLNADWVHADSLAAVMTALSASPLVDEVDCQQSLVEALNANIARISVILGVFILLLLFISFVLINNTVRLNVFAKRFAVYTMQLVGATRSFVRRPFVCRSLLQGFLAGLLSTLALGVAFYLLHDSFPQLLDIVTPIQLAQVAAVVICSGILICVLSTWVVVNRLLSFSKDELYG